jgi:integrase
MKLTQAAADDLLRRPIPADKSELRFFDEDLSGFGVRLRRGANSKPQGRWIVQYRVKGKTGQTTESIGAIGIVNAKAAREKAKGILAQAQLGVDLRDARTETRERSKDTFGIIAARYLEKRRADLKPRSFDQVETHLTKHWSRFDRVPVHEITKRDIAIRLGEIAEGTPTEKKRGPIAANRARASLSSFFSWAMAEGIVDANPVIATNRQGAEQTRDRVLTDAELVAIWNASNGDDYGAIIRLLILTGQRRDEVGAIARAELDLPGRKWTIPAARTKNGRTHEIALSDPALSILKAATTREGREDRDAIFGDGAAGNGFSGWSKAKAALDKRIIGEAKQKKKSAAWRLHDIRRTVATRMIDLGVPSDHVEAVLNHVSGHRSGVAGVYNRALYTAEKRAALDRWASHVSALLAGKAADNVTPLRREA